MPNPVKSLGYIKCHSSSSPRSFKSPSNSIRYHHEKICSWPRRPKSIYPVNIQLTLEFLKGLFLVLLFSYFTLITSLMMLCVILLSMLMTLLSALNVIDHLICGKQLELASELEFDLQDTVEWGGSGLLISVLEKPNQFYSSNNTGTINVKMDRSVL